MYLVSSFRTSVTTALISSISFTIDVLIAAFIVFIDMLIPSFFTNLWHRLMVCISDSHLFGLHLHRHRVSLSNNVHHHACLLFCISRYFCISLIVICIFFCYFETLNFESERFVSTFTKEV